jgi:small subunit ribosomal protein S18
MKNFEYKDTITLSKYLTEQGKILSARLTGLSAKNQRKISKAIKQARLLGFLSFVQNK